MIIINPQGSVVAFNLLEYLVENEPSPKQEIRSFLRARYETITGEKVKVAENEDEADEVEGDDSDLRETLLEAVYGHFSVDENGNILLISNDGADLLLTEADARELLPAMRARLKDRADKLTQLLG